MIPTSARSLRHRRHQRVPRTAQQLGFYFATEPNGFFTAEKVVPFLRDLLKHLRGNVIVVWERGGNHKG